MNRISPARARAQPIELSSPARRRASAGCIFPAHRAKKRPPGCGLSRFLDCNANESTLPRFLSLLRQTDRLSLPALSIASIPRQRCDSKRAAAPRCVACAGPPSLLPFLAPLARCAHSARAAIVVATVCRARLFFFFFFVSTSLWMGIFWGLYIMSIFFPIVEAVALPELNYL